MRAKGEIFTTIISIEFRGKQLINCITDNKIISKQTSKNIHPMTVAMNYFVCIVQSPESIF